MQVTSVPEAIAYLDRLEAEIVALASSVREVRYMLFDTLDKDPDTLVD